MGGLQWRMPAADEPAAVLIDVTVAEVAEALEAPLQDQLRLRVDRDVLVIYSVTAERRAVGVLLVRYNESFVWRISRAKPLTAAEFEAWLGRSHR